MAFRGGRGRGRGRGGGRAGPPPIRDDEGNFVVIKRLEGPPPLFPPLEMLPEKPKATPEETELVTRRRALNIFWEGSSYHIEKPKAKLTGIAAEIDRYADKRLSSRTRRLPLSSVLKLTSSFFPTELLGREKKRIRPSSTSGISQWTIQAGAGKSDLRRLDKLVSLEQKLEKLTEKGGKNEEEKKEGEGEGEEDGEVEEEEDEELDDDYAQNFGFDDDEDYDFDDDGGGGDDEATF